MSPAWHTPLTWQVDQLVTEADLNSQLRDNLGFLKNPPTAFVSLDEQTDYVTSSNDFVDADRTRLALSLTTAGGDLLVVFFGMLRNPSNNGGGSLDVALDGSRTGKDDGLVGIDTGSTHWQPVSFCALLREVPAGQHNLHLQWKRSHRSGAIYMSVGAGTTNADYHPQFWAREIS
ncbi:MAG: hypothetical protein OXP68_05650 [Anaerolineaceae bacterium]|nr:hypothetical protein [Anaerolineaceae bacterium]MDE0327580.1 hypothetical protein [Anaerolineaceae bacterium]